MDKEKNMNNKKNANKPHSRLDCDVVIVGCGVGGLYSALNLDHSKKILMLSKDAVDICDSMLAQGGICVLHDEGDYDAFFEDTLRAGHYENRKESVDIMIRSSRDVINDLISKGVEFERDEKGELTYTKEGAHSIPRICFHEDITGKEITTKLLANVRKLDNVSIMEYTCMTDLLEDETGRICGALAEKDNSSIEIYADDVIFATGGIGGQYAYSTNYRILTGDGCRIASDHGAELEHMDYVQIHPTCLYRKKKGRNFLISESARGEGAIILNHKGERFVDELLPRDVVTEAIRKEMEKEGVEYEFLSFENVPDEVIRNHFPHICETCLEDGYDIFREPVPIVPAQHYFMGGIHVDSNSETTLPHLYAVGETSCNGVHGKNRLASNSLLESLVFAARAAKKINSEAIE